MNTIKIAWLFPDTLYLHGCRGDVLALKRFAGFAGLNPEVEKIDFDTENFDPMDFDIIYCPPGEITSFPVIIDKLKPLRQKFIDFIEAGRPLIVTGTSMAMWCTEINRVSGEIFSGLDIVKASVRENENVYGDDNYFKCTYNDKEFEIIGNQIQMADFINNGTEPFGEIIYGYGNTGNDREEGFKISNSIFTNSLGPVFVTNPRITMEIINVAAANKGIETEDYSYDSDIEDNSFKTKKDFILTKESRLTNGIK